MLSFLLSESLYLVACLDRGDVQAPGLFVLVSGVCHAVLYAGFEHFEGFLDCLLPHLWLAHCLSHVVHVVVYALAC